MSAVAAPLSVTAYRVSDDEFAIAKQKLIEFGTIPSVSHPTSPYYSMETLAKAANFATNLLKEIGFQTRQVSIDGSAPFVLGERLVDPSLPTILGYAHYDLQPVNTAQWGGLDPFQFTERDGRLYGRGASDDKGGIIALVTALGAYLKAYGALPVNMKILFEGEEEYGSTHMAALLKQEAVALKADAMVVMDCGNADANTGTLCSSTRGVVNLTMEVKTMKQAVHSGTGCLVRDPAMLMAELMVSLKYPRQIPGFMDGRVELKPAEREILRKDSQTCAKYAEEFKLLPGESLRGNPAVSVDERVTEEPSISFLNGSWGEPKGGNSIQESARCEIGIRITGGQHPDLVAKSVKDYLLGQAADRQIPLTVEEPEHGCFPFKADVSRPFAQKYLKALETEFGKKYAAPSGGALPHLHQFHEAQPNMEMVLPGVEDPDCNAHSFNESQHLGILRKAINSFVGFLHQFKA